MWTTLVFTTYVFISVSRSIRARVEEDDSLVSVDTRAIAGKLRWFPLVFALVGCPLVGLSLHSPVPALLPSGPPPRLVPYPLS
jgi:hypothetical protein